jgi:hypothetical protein
MAAVPHATASASANRKLRERDEVFMSACLERAPPAHAGRPRRSTARLRWLDACDECEAATLPAGARDAEPRHCYQTGTPAAEILRRCSGPGPGSGDWLDVKLDRTNVSRSTVGCRFDKASLGMVAL